jgi:hypothetical protein
MTVRASLRIVPLAPQIGEANRTFADRIRALQIRDPAAQRSLVVRTGITFISISDRVLMGHRDGGQRATSRG